MFMYKHHIFEKKKNDCAEISVIESQREKLQFETLNFTCDFKETVMADSRLIFHKTFTMVMFNLWCIFKHKQYRRKQWEGGEIVRKRRMSLNIQNYIIKINNIYLQKHTHTYTQSPEILSGKLFFFLFCKAILRTFFWCFSWLICIIKQNPSICCLQET